MSASDTSNGGTGGGGTPGPGGGSATTPGIASSSSAANTTTGAKTSQTKSSSVDVANSGSPATSTASASSVVVTCSGGGSTTAGGAAIKSSGTLCASMPIALNTVPATTSATIRTMPSGQSAHVRVVVPNTIVTTSMVKQMDHAVPGRSPVSTVTTTTSRTVSNTAITLTRPQANFLPRTGVASSQMAGVGVANAQRLLSPIRTAIATGTPATVTGIAPGSSFVRGAAVTRNTSSPATSGISPTTTTAWMTANTTGQVQLIRAISNPAHKRIIAGVQAAAISGAVTSPTTTTAQSNAGQSPGHPSQASNQSQSSPNSQQQQTYVATIATVLPPRPQQATLVYSSNVACTSQSLTQAQAFNPAVGAGQRFAVATPLTAATGQRHIRPIPLGKTFSAAKLNTTSISIRSPIPQLAPTIATGMAVTSSLSSNAGNSPRSTNITAVTSSTGNVIAAANLPTRIIQLQQPGGAVPQIISSGSRLPNNVMLQPIIVNTSGSGKISFRPPTTMAGKPQPSLTITQLGIGKLPAAGTATESVSPSIASTSTVQTSNLCTTAGAHLVNVSQGATGLLTTQNLVSSSGAGAMVPLAITTRGAAAGNILTGTITPIKNPNGITVGKVTQVLTAGSAEVGSPTSSSAPGNLFIHHPGNAHRAGAAVAVVSSNVATVTSSATSNTGPSSFLPPGSTIYYESVPANSVQVSTGVLSLTTTTVSSSAVTQSLNTSSISSLPFATHPVNSTATFTVVPSSSARTIGHLQIPSGSTGTQIQAVPLRFSTQIAGTSVADAIAASQSAAQLVSSSGQQILIPASSHATATLTGQHMVIPLQTSIKVTSGVSTGNTVVTNFLRKRDSDGSPIRAAKNLCPTLLSMSSNIVSSSEPISVPFMSTCALTTEALAKQNAILTGHSSRAASPASSDGSTTVSADSTPEGQQTEDTNLLFTRLPDSSDATHFNPINELYSHHHSMGMQHNLHGTPISSRSCSLDQQHLQALQRFNGGTLDCPPRKKSRRSTNDSQLSSQSQTSLTLPPPNMMYSSVEGITGVGKIALLSAEGNSDVIDNYNKNNNMPQTAGNKENTKPITNYFFKRPRNLTLLSSYKMTWKPNHNHFLRYTDVKPREERLPTVMDFANQPNILSRLNGWKVYYVQAQLETIVEDENVAIEQLSSRLTQLETNDIHESNSDIDRICDLMKGNIQRSKIVADGVTEAINLMMKIFEHKTNVTDIISRCTSKRNFKKREKL